MHATTVAVDLAKSVFQIAVADENWRVVETQRLTRSQFERWFINRSVGLVVMEACGSAHHWARWLGSLGIEVRLLPAQYVRAYVRRNKTDATDAAALLEAARASDLRPVRVKSVEQQALQGLHRIRSLWMGARTSRINALRGFCREFGIAIPVGARTGIEVIGRVLADPQSAVPELIRHTASQLLEETKRKFVVTTDSRHSLPVAPDLVQRRFNPEAPNQLWSGDMNRPGYRGGRLV
jgi:transposase